MYTGISNMKQSLQGPYFGQHVWFRRFHPEDLPSAKKRHDEQTLRVSQVLDSILQGKEYHFGNRLYIMGVAMPWRESWVWSPAGNLRVARMPI